MKSHTCTMSAQSLLGIVLVLAATLYLGAATPALAVQTDHFELEGDIADDADPGNRSDWSSLFDSMGNEKALPPNFLGTQFTRDFVLGGVADTTTFDSAKDTGDIATWECTESNNVGDKSDLLNTYATFVKDPGTSETLLYFGAERFSNSGSGAVGVWFLQDPTVGCTAPPKNGTASFTGHHVDGDLLLTAGFTQGGSVTSVDVYRWIGGANGQLDTTPMLAGIDCKTTGGNDSVCATSNTGPVTTPWPSEDKDGDNVLDVSEFVEGGFNLTRLGLELGCFSKVLIESRSSASWGAGLIDYALGSFVTCNDSSACTVDSCDPAVGCVFTPISCDDFNACTDDTCDPAVGCLHTDNTAGCDDHNACTDDTCDPVVGCLHTIRTGSCDDGDACTQTDTCLDGVCTGSNPVVCTASDQCHDAGTCDSASGTCSNPAKTDGVACNDNDACTQTDTCVAGVCTGGNPVICTASDQCHDAGTCDSLTGECSNPAKGNGETCNDNDACTQTDTCQAGVCTGGNPVVCTASDQCHEAGTCNSVTGTCSNPAKTDGVACNDNDACTQSDTCIAGVCTGSNPVICTSSDQCHDVGTCDPTSGGCSNPAKADGTACNDRNACTAADTCESGICAGSPVAEGTPCDDANACTLADACHSGSCVGDPAKDGVPCDDGNTCTQTDSCQGGTCVGADPAGDGTPCDDNNSCTQIDACQAGFCVGGVPATDGTPCDDNNVCSTDDTCQAGLCKGVILPNGTVCDDSNECTAADTCQAGTCLGNAVQDGLTCDDGDACTESATCSNGSCRGSDPIVCEALDDCHEVGVCDHASGVCSNPVKTNGAACDDDDACTQTDTCVAGVCTGGNPVICAASDQCHDAGTCDPTSGECSNPAKTDGVACGDGDACTQTDTCVAGVCTGGNPVICAASDQCHNAGTCNSVTGTCSNPANTDGVACNDNDACTQTDTCVAGVCTGGNPVICAASDQCHNAGTCDSASGTCSDPVKADGASCNDGNNCTAGDVCVSGICLGELPGCGDGILEPSCGEECDDGNANDRDGCTSRCTLEAPTVCGSVPAMDCRPLAVARKGLLSLRGFVPKKSKKAFSWQYSKGAITTKADFGDPLVDTSYEICIYDQQHGTSNLVMSAGVPAGGMCGRKPCWKASRTGFRYRNKSLQPDGLYSLTLKVGAKPGRTRIVLRGKNQNLPVPQLPLVQDSTVTVQLKNSLGVCWETRHSAPAAKNMATRRPVFKDKAD